MNTNTQPTRFFSFTTSVLTTCLLAASLVGCGGSGGSGSAGGSVSPSQKTQAQQDVNTGTAQLNTILKSATNVTTQNLQAAEASFASAYSEDHTNANAAAGYSVSLLALDAQKTLDLLGTSITTLDTSSSSTLASRLSAARFGFLGSLAPQVSIEQIMPISKNGIANLSLFNPSASTRAFPTSPTYAQVVSQLQSLQTDLATIDNILSTSANLPTDVSPFVIIDPQNTGSTIKIGTVEMKSLQAAVEALEGTIDLLLAYDFSFSSSYPYSSSFASAFPSATNGSPIPPSTYLPGGTFGTLRSGSLLNNAATMLKTTLATGDAAILAYQQRTGTGWAINPGAVSSSTISNYQADEAIVRNDLNSDFTYTFSDGSTQTVKLKEWLSNPPSSLVALMPTITDASGSISFNASSFPDLTFGGLFASPLTSTQVGLIVKSSGGSIPDSQTVATVVGSIFGGM